MNDFNLSDNVVGGIIMGGSLIAVGLIVQVIAAIISGVQSSWFGFLSDITYYFSRPKNLFFWLLIILASIFY
jgi:hypothetical protein